MSTITPAATFAVNAPFNTNPAYSGTFIPAIWSAKMNAKFYATSVYGDIANTDWQGEISGMGDKVIINTAPSISVSDYVVGGGIQYEVPTPDTQELVIDKGKYFAFQIADVLEYQSKPNLLDTFSTDAAQQMRTRIDANVLYQTFNKSATANKGSGAGVKSGAFSLGTDDSPIAINATAGDAANILTKILELASVLDEQNIPDDSRWLLLDPLTRTLLLQTGLWQVQNTGDDKSPVRNGMVGMIDRFKIYITNQLPRASSGTNTPWLSGDGSENSITSTGDDKRRVILAGHKSALTFASQITKMETIRNPNDFGDYIRSLNVYGFKVVKPEAMATLIVK